MNFIKPNKLSPGDTVAIVSPSWGGPSKFPWVYEKGIQNLENLGLKIKEYPTARASAEFLYANPKARAEDLNNAFADKKIKAIIATIGGDDSIRILPFLDGSIAQKNPKILMGYSDTCILTTFYNCLGLVTFNGPAVMAGFAQMNNFPDQYRQHIKDLLFIKNPNYLYKPFPFYAEGYPKWDKKEDADKIKEKKPADGWHWLQGRGVNQGELFGGCIEAMEFMKGTRFWPKEEFWDRKVFFLETSEEKPSCTQIKYILRNYGAQGIFDKINALLFGRARDYSDEEKMLLDKTILKIVKDEFGNENLTIVSNMNFGHTDPQIILPLGVRAELNCEKKDFRLVESPFQ